MTQENWLDIYSAAKSATQINQMPIKNRNPWCLAYFICELLLGSLFILNMFIEVVISTFNREKEKISYNTKLTKLESQYIETCIACYQKKPLKIHVRSEFEFRNKAYEIANSTKFDFFIFACIVTNLILLSLTWYDEEKQMEVIIEWINTGLAGVYTFEFFIKFTGYGFYYFRDAWNLVDFLIVVTAWTAFLLEQFSPIKLPSIMMIIRAFRILRILKLIQKMKELRRILETFIRAIPALINVGALWLLFLFIFSVLGVNLFATVQLQLNLNEQVNFRSYATAMLTLFKSSTGENWNYLMDELSNVRSIDFQCKIDQSYDEMQRNGIQGCGFPVYSYLFFITFQVFVTFILLNLFIAIILEGFSLQLQEDEQRIQPQIIQEFINQWQKYDPKATGMILVDDLENLVIDLVNKEMETKLKRSKQEQGQRQDILFNFHHVRLLRLAAYWKRKEDDGSPEYKRLVKSISFQRQLKRHFDQFLGLLKLPTYDKLKYYNFHDILISFVRFTFSQMHLENFIQRQQRIQNVIETGQHLEFFDRIVKESIEYQELSRIDQEYFDEISTQHFHEIIYNIEIKEKIYERKILKLTQMRNLRINLVKRNAGRIDIFCDLVIDSSLVIGARCIQKFIQQKKSVANQRRRGILNGNFRLNTIPDRTLIQRQPLQTQKQILRGEIKARIGQNRRRKIAGEQPYITSSSSCSASDSSPISSPSAFQSQADQGINQDYVRQREQSNQLPQISQHRSNQSSLNTNSQQSSRFLQQNLIAHITSNLQGETINNLSEQVNAPQTEQFVRKLPDAEPQTNHDEQTHEQSAEVQSQNQNMDTSIFINSHRFYKINPKSAQRIKSIRQINYITNSQIVQNEESKDVRDENLVQELVLNQQKDIRRAIVVQKSQSTQLVDGKKSNHQIEVAAQKTLRKNKLVFAGLNLELSARLPVKEQNQRNNNKTKDQSTKFIGTIFQNKRTISLPKLLNNIKQQMD